MGNTSYNATSIYLNNQQCKTQPTLINLNPNEFNQELHNYPFAVNLDKCSGSCNTLTIHPAEYVFQTKQKI